MKNVGLLISQWLPCSLVIWAFALDRSGKKRISNSRNCDVIPAVIITLSDALPLCHINWDNRRNDARSCGQLHVIIRIALWTFVCNNYKGKFY